MESLKVMKISISNEIWTYRGEGNENLVLVLPRKRQVLRLRKSVKSKCIDEALMWQKLNLDARFIGKVMKALLSDTFISSPVLISLPNTEVEMLNTNLEFHRPANRLHKELKFTGGTLCPDHTFLPVMDSAHLTPTYCVELKPKQGVFPHFTRGKMCAFCLKQQLKLKDCMVRERSKYCPLDLFSGDPERMKSALLSLLETPQNNLRIFKDGCLVFGEGDPASRLQNVLSDWFHHVPGSNLQDRFSCLVHEALTRNLCATKSNQSFCQKWMWDGVPQNTFVKNKEEDILRQTDEDTCYDLPEPHCNWTKFALPEGSILKLLAQAQALDVLGPAGTWMLYKDQLNHETSGDKYIDEFGYVDCLLEKFQSSQLSPLEGYLISATVRDCSILICFQEMFTDGEESACSIVKDGASVYGFNIAVVDVDPKPLSCVEKHCKRDTAVIEACKHASLCNNKKVS